MNWLNNRTVLTVIVEKVVNKEVPVVKKVPRTMEPAPTPTVVAPPAPEPTLMIVHSPTPEPRASIQGTFRLGSTKDEVRSVQGTPTRINLNPEWWYYGGSYVAFDSNGRVQGWSDSAGVLKLK